MRSLSSTPTSRLSELEHGSPNRNSARWNAHVTPPKRTTALPPFAEDGTTPHLRGRTISATSEGKLSTDKMDVGRGASSLSLPSPNTDEMRSTFQERSRSPGHRILDATGQEAEANLKSSWWAGAHVARPWEDSPKRKQTIPKEQTEAFQSTRTKVAQAVASALDVGTDVLHEALFFGVDFLKFAPVPGLAEAAKTLLNIWDAVQQVDMYRLACLRLTERCADILLSIRHEIQEAGGKVGEELAAPIAKLEE